MSTVFKFGAAVDIAAAWILVEPILSAKKRGDLLTHAEILAVSGAVEVRRLAPRIRRYFAGQRGIHLRPVAGVGWTICTAGDQVTERTEHRRKRAHYEKRQELHAATTAPDSELTPEERRHKDLHVRAASAALTADRVISKERRLILGVPPERPRLSPVK